MARSEQVWGPDAKVYNPSRWIVNREKPSQYKFNTFHAGPRLCIGQQYATTQAMTVLSMILQSLDVQLEEPAKKRDYSTSFVLPMVGGLRIKVARRFTKEG